MIRTLPAAAVLVALGVALTGCGSDPEPAAAPSSTAPAATSAVPSPTIDPRRGCRAVDDLTGKSTPTAHRDAGALAAESPVPAIKQAGIDLINAANSRDGDNSVEAKLALDRAVLAVAEACGAEFGDGPW